MLLFKLKLVLWAFVAVYRDMLWPGAELTKADRAYLAWKRSQHR